MRVFVLRAFILVFDPFCSSSTRDWQDLYSAAITGYMMRRNTPQHKGQYQNSPTSEAHSIFPSVTFLILNSMKRLKRRYIKKHWKQNLLPNLHLPVCLTHWNTGADRLCGSHTSGPLVLSLRWCLLFITLCPLTGCCFTACFFPRRQAGSLL